MLSDGFDVEDVSRMVKVTFAQVVTGILENARRESRPVCEVARTLAWQNHCKLNEPEVVSSDKMSRALSVLTNQGLSGVWRRLAWRIHRRWPSLKGATHRVAVDRYAESTLGATKRRLAESHVLTGKGVLGV
jgi:hypothetical protein